MTKSVFDKFSDILNFECVNLHKGEFYSKILDEIYGEVKFVACAVYFSDNSSFELKSLSGKSGFEFQKGEEFLNFLNSKNDKTFSLNDKNLKSFFASEFYLKTKDKFFVVSKLEIKKSTYGFIILMSDKKLSSDEISKINLFTSIYSYLIKDFELNKVFKNQLSLLQDAIFEKEKAQKTIQRQNKKLIEANNAKNSFLANC